MKNNVFKSLKPFVIKHEPEILTGIGISGMIFTTVSAVKATIDAVKVVEEKRGAVKPKAKDIIKWTWKLYLPSLASMAVSIPCIICSNGVSNKRNAALAAAYTVSETALQEYQNKTREIVGTKKEQEIHEAVSSESIQKTYEQGSKNIVITGDGDSLFFEPLSGRYFKTNWNKILKAANELNADALTDICGSITLTDWFDKLGLDKTDISDYMGWEIFNGKDGMINITIDSTLTPDDIPCGAIHYVTNPKYLK